MFCPYCGNQTADGAAFCASCGKSLSGAPAPAAPAVDYQAQKNAMRQGELESLKNTLAYFNQKRSEFEEYDLVCQLVNDFKGGAKSSLLVWGIIISVFGIIATFGSLSSGGPEAMLGAAAFILLPGALMIFGGIRMKVNNRKQLAYFRSEYERLSEELYNHYAAYPNCPVGPEYANPEILEIFLSIMESGRADTIKESINLAISEADRAEVNAYLDAIERATEAINVQTRAAAIFAAASFFKD